MIDLITDTLQPLIVELLLALILAALAWLGRFLPERLRVGIEAKYRDDLHSALNTGVGYALDVLAVSLRTNPAVGASDAAVAHVLEYIERSVPEAIRRLGPSREMLREMARAKLNAALVGTALDPLARDLRAAGVPVP